MSVYRHRGVSPPPPETVSQAGLAITDGFTAFFPITELETRGEGIDSGAPYQTDPRVNLPLRFFPPLSRTIPRKFHRDGESPVSRAIMQRP